MYISSITIHGFRNFETATINFQEGVNIIIGHNNAGKTNLLKSLSLILDGTASKKLNIDDFYKYVDLNTLKQNPPKVSIQLTISESPGEDLTSDDLVTVGTWLTQLQSPYSALLTYEFFLPQSEWSGYLTAMQTITDIDKAWDIIKHDFLRKYIYKIYGGDPSLHMVADSDSINKFDYQFLNAIRDVERDMFTGKNTLLREIVDFFIDYEIKNGTDTEPQKIAALKAQKEAFAASAKALLILLQDRMKEGEGHILRYAKATGASFNNTSEPAFDGTISEAELYSTLRLIIKYTTGISIPATHNGLGYNNLIYMSLLLAKMQVDTNGNYLGSNAKVFPILVIEEPEAHLHPAMQYKFLKFLKQNIEQKARQIFITSHSTHITAAVSLDEIICLSYLNNVLHIGYPGKAFGNSPDDIKSKAYVQRFLDATRSDMLFAKSIVFVEGLAEQLLLSVFAEYSGQSLEDEHVAIINIGGRHFDHFIKLFDTTKPNTIAKKVACITDRDPVRKLIGTNDKPSWCYPYESNTDPTKYNYSVNGTINLAAYASHPSLRFFSQDAAKGKTLEYELVIANSASDLLFLSSLPNQAEFAYLKTAIAGNLSLATIEASGVIRDNEITKRIILGLRTKMGIWTDAEIATAFLASRYLSSANKGENALELSLVLAQNLKATPPQAFTVPHYITEAINWVCR